MKNLITTVAIICAFQSIAQSTLVSYDIQFDKEIVDCAVYTYENKENEQLGKLESIIDSKISLLLVPDREYRVVINNTDVIEITEDQIARRIKENQFDLLSEGTVYSVQVGAFSNEPPSELNGINEFYFDTKTERNLTRCLVGTYSTPEEALNALASMRKLGYGDAFPVAYKDGKRILFSSGSNDEGIASLK